MTLWAVSCRQPRTSSWSLPFPHAQPSWFGGNGATEGGSWPSPGRCDIRSLHPVPSLGAGYGYRKAKDARCGCHLQPQGAQERRGGRRGCCAGHEGGALARCTEPPPGRPVTARTSSAAPSTHVRLCRCDPAPFCHRWRGEVGVGNESPRRRHLEREGP